MSVPADALCWGQLQRDSPDVQVLTLPAASVLCMHTKNRGPVSHPHTSDTRQNRFLGLVSSTSWNKASLLDILGVFFFTSCKESKLAYWMRLSSMFFESVWKIKLVICRCYIFLSWIECLHLGCLPIQFLFHVIIPWESLTVMLFMRCELVNTKV